MENKDLKNLPIYQKADEIGNLVRAFITTIPEDDEYLKAISGMMNENALILQVKIAGAEGGDFYDIRMQNAALIRQAGMDLYVQIGSLRFHENYSQPEYIDLLREEIDAFRELFVQWVAGFDFAHFNWDDWGLFNPPHLNPRIVKNPIDEIDWDKEDEESDREWEELEKDELDDEFGEEDFDDDDDLPDWLK